MDVIITVKVDGREIGRHDFFKEHLGWENEQTIYDDKTKKALGKLKIKWTKMVLKQLKETP